MFSFPPSRHEVYAAVGRRTGQRRKIVVVVVYIPPFYNAEQNRSLFNYVNDVALAIKSKYDDPYIFVGGDFNPRSFRLAMRDLPEIKAADIGATRGSATFDIIASNYNDSMVDFVIVEPIWNEDGVRTDHQTLFSSYRIPRVPSYAIEKYSYRHLTEDGHSRFGEWLNKVS